MKSLEKYGIKCSINENSTLISFRKKSFILIEKSSVKISPYLNKESDENWVRIFNSELIHKLNWEVIHTKQKRSNCDCGNCGGNKVGRITIKAFNDTGNALSRFEFAFILLNVDDENKKESDNDKEFNDVNNSMIDFSQIISTVKREIERLQGRNEVVFYQNK